MALDPLATVADLTALGVDTSNEARVTILLNSVSAAIREAAGCTITLHEQTVTLTGSRSRWLKLPGWAIREVTDVASDEGDVTGWKLLDGRLWRWRGWEGASCNTGVVRPWDEPSLITVTYTQGVDATPADLLPLIASLVSAGLAQSGEGFDPRRGMSYERIDDYQYGMSIGNDEIVDPTALPARTRQMLAARFGAASAVTGSY